MKIFGSRDGSVLATAVRGAGFGTMRVHRPADATAGLAGLRTRTVHEGGAALLHALGSDSGRAFFSLLFGNSPYLTRLLLRDPEFARALVSRTPEALAAQVLGELAAADASMNRDQLMQLLRRQRSRVAILAAVYDCFGVWDVMACAAMLSDMADRAVHLAAEHLLLDRVARGELAPPEGDPDARRCGYFVLAAGGHGARELSYSSDIALIALYDPSLVRYTGTRTLGDCFVRVTRDLARILQARTGDGYVFRTDLRLRPDAQSTPPAMTADFALDYYQRSGRTWERAALIKARPVAGDLAAAKAFLERLGPFIWDEGLDFASVEDIRSMNRQIHEFHRRRAPRAGGRDLELSPGGIREIEFFVQMHQLAYGGRSRPLRGSNVLTMLDAIEREHYILPREASDLREAYILLRRIEHRVQMVNDEPTRALPASDAGLENIACLMGLDAGADITRVAEDAMERVHALFRARFTVPESERNIATLILDGPEGGPGALEALEADGFQRPGDALDTFRGWAEGRHPSTSSARAQVAVRDVLHEIVAALVRTPNPDRTLARMDHFFTALPPDISFFAMLRANTWLLNLVAVVMGGAPRLAEALRLRPRILEAVLDPSFFLPIPEAEELARELDDRLNGIGDYGKRADVVAGWTEERRFQVGVQTLENLVTVDEASRSLSDLADVAIAAFLRMAVAETEEEQGQVSAGECAIVSLGELGAREMTLESDPDLVFVADFPDDAGCRPFYSRVAERLVDALQRESGGSPLYRVEARHGPTIAGESPMTTLHAFREHYGDPAHTGEHMALTRARVVCGDPAATRAVDTEIRRVLALRRDPVKLAGELIEMRERIAKEHGGSDPFGLRHARGGLLDLQFIAQYFVLVYSHRSPNTMPGATVDCFEALAAAGVIPVEEMRLLVGAFRMQRTIGAMLGLTSSRDIPIREAPESLRRRLVLALECETFDEVEATLGGARERAFDIFQSRVGLTSR